MTELEKNHSHNLVTLAAAVMAATNEMTRDELVEEVVAALAYIWLALNPDVTDETVFSANVLAVLKEKDPDNAALYEKAFQEASQEDSQEDSQ